MPESRNVPSPTSRRSFAIFRSVLAGGGILCATVSVFARNLGLDSSQGIGTGELLLFLTGIALITAGLLGKRTIPMYHVSAVIILNTVVLLGLLEMGATVVNTVRTTPAKMGGWPVNYSELPYYRAAPWGTRYWHEYLDSGRVNYYPYALWRRHPYAGETINIDEHGRRMTPGAHCEENAVNVFVFGGSTMWGYGSPDRGTIPAHLEKLLDERMNTPVCVVNYGETGYVSAQSLILLERELIAGHIPDVVVFYDGVNDIYAAYQSGHAGVHQNLDQLAARFERSRPRLIELLSGLAIVRLVKSFGPDSRVSNYLNTGATAETLSPEIVDAYLGTIGVVDALAEKYAFKARFFWQPLITVGEKPLTVLEQATRESMDSALRDLQVATHRVLVSRMVSNGSIHDLSRVFDDVEPYVWIDADGHVVPEANEIIAKEMMHFID